MAGQRLGDDDAVVSGGPRHPGDLASGPQVSWGAAGHSGGVAYLESDLGVASTSPLFSHQRGADSGWTLEGRTQRVSAPGTRSHGGLSGEDGSGDPADLCAWRVGPARADAPAASAQPPEPSGPSDEDQ